MQKIHKYLLFGLMLICASCGHRSHIVAFNSMNSEERLKSINDEYSISLEELNVYAKNQYPYIKEFTDSLIKSGLNYVQYMDKNKIVDCSEIVEALRVKKGKLLENRQWMDNYFREIDTIRMIPISIDVRITGNYDAATRRYILDSTEQHIIYSLYDLKRATELIFEFTYDTSFSQNEFRSNLKLKYLHDWNNPIGPAYVNYLTGDIQEHCDYLKEFMLELINHKYDYNEYLMNNPYVKIRESESSSLVTFFSEDIKNLNYYDKKLENYVDCVFKDEYIFFSTLDEDDLEVCMKLSDQALMYIVYGCDDEIHFLFDFKPNQQDSSKYDYYLTNIISLKRSYEQWLQVR